MSIFLIRLFVASVCRENRSHVVGVRPQTAGERLGG